MLSEKGSGLIIGILIGFLVASGLFGAYYFGTQKQIPNSNNPPPITNPQQTPQAVSDISNWKTYQSLYGYSINYPSTWVPEGSVGDKGVKIWSKPEYIKLNETLGRGFDKEDYATIEVGAYLKGSNTAFGIVNDNTDLKTFVTNYYASFIPTSIQDITLDETPAMLVVYKRMVFKPGISIHTEVCPPQDEPCTVQDGELKAVWTKHNGDIMHINYQYGRQYTDSALIAKIFDDAVASFKFAK